jgi:hypothetical protein
LQDSLAFTLSRKLRLKGIKQVYNRFGYPIKVNVNKDKGMKEHTQERKTQKDGNIKGRDRKAQISFWRPVSFKRDLHRLQKKQKTKNTSYGNMLKELNKFWVPKLKKNKQREEVCCMPNI